MKLNSYHFGLLSESIAILFLIMKGYKILHWRYKTHLGEIDMIVRKRSLIVIVEVKSRRYKHCLVEEVISPYQIKRIQRTAQFFLSKNPRYCDYNIRFDLILIRNLFHLNHHKNFC